MIYIWKLIFICFWLGHSEIKLPDVMRYSFVQIEVGRMGKHRLVGCSRCHTVYWIEDKKK